MKTIKLFTIIFSAAMLLFGAEALAASFDGEEPRIEILTMQEGTTIDGADVSGKTLAEAKAIVDGAHADTAAGSLVVLFGESSAEIPFAQIDLKYSEESLCETIIALGNEPGLIDRYKSSKDAETDGTAYVSEFTYSEQKLAAYIKNVLGTFDTAVDATITLEKGKFVITPDRSGLVINEENTLEAIKVAIAENGPASGMRVTGDAAVTEARVKASDLEMITDELGTCSTKVGGTDNRAHNVALGCSKINGLMLMPGESASASDLMEKRDVEHGYRKAPQYVNGNSVDAIGGGVCQVSSTLYNALLEAELQIDERHNHSMLVSYLPASCDAAISDGYKDLKFTNNTKYPIYIEGHSKSRVCTFTVYGRDERPANREVKYNSVITKQSTPQDKIVYDSTKPATYKKTTGTRHPATSSYLEKIVYIDGKEVSREIVSKDVYEGSRKTVTIGTAVAEPTYPSTPTSPTTPTEPTAPEPTQEPEPPEDPTPGDGGGD